jgi:predicted Zn-dependent protease
MSRWIAALALMALAPLYAQEKPQPEKSSEPKETPQNVEQYGLPPEEDTQVSTPVYAFNPLQAKKEISVGNQYFKRGSYRAAATRFEEATKWNSGEAEAWLRLGEAREKLRDTKAAHEAFAKYLELAGDSKVAGEIRKKLEKHK